MLQFFHNLFVEKCFKDGKSFTSEVAFCVNEIENNVIENSFRKNSLIFKYPGNGHYYFALTSETFFEAVLFLVRCTTGLLYYTFGFKE